MSKPQVLLSVDNNPEYLFLTPIVCYSWHLQGFSCRIAFNNVLNTNFILDVLTKLGIEYYAEHINMPSTTTNKALYTQCYRMYMTQYLDNDIYYLMSDIDMFIGSSFLYRDFDKVNSFGYDLTGYSQVPMCYVGMSGKKWKELMGDYSVDNDLSIYAKKDSGNFYVSWGCDQDILTGRLRGILGFHAINFIERKTDPTNQGLPLGRWDRHNWIKPQSEVHDVHLLRSPQEDINFIKIQDMCKDLYPNNNWEWMNEYKLKFKEVYG